jgi:hypothetical protein
MTGPRIRSRVLRASRSAAALERVGPLTPYLTQTIVEDALAAGPGSRVEVELSLADGTHLLWSLRVSLDALAARGIAVDVRTGGGAWTTAHGESAA